jgi:hypothetical protein
MPLPRSILRPDEPKDLDLALANGVWPSDCTSERRIDSPSARLRRKRPDVFRSTLLGVHSPFLDRVMKAMTASGKGSH